ncbi:SspB family protein [Paracoccus pacificus]|uniref:SspB family protein n=1 Tax=Paracoccus pacificus TaxID=1463598 RepID=A0ABW4RA51_9RHOB
MARTPTRTIDYGNLMHRAMQGLISEVLQGVAENGLPGEHHFFITFDTREDGVEIADWLRDRYPEEMTIVIQNWFSNLTVNPDGFTITLNFGNSPEPLVIPFSALRTFVDPSVEFGLRFETQDVEDEDEDEPDGEDGFDEDDTVEEPATKPKGGSGAEVVSLDKWRK